MNTFIVALGTSLVLATSSMAMTTSDLTQHDIADGATGANTMGEVLSVDTLGMNRNKRNVVNLPDTLALTVFETQNNGRFQPNDRR